MILFKSNDESFTSKIEYTHYKTAFVLQKPSREHQAIDYT